MRKILLVGKFNETVNNVDAFLSKYFTIQLCTENVEVFKGMMKIVNPDVVIVCLMGFSEDNIEMFNHVRKFYEETPVLTIGTAREVESYQQFYNIDQFENLLRPVTNMDVLEGCCRKSGLEIQKNGEGEDNLVLIDREAEKKQILIVDDDPIALRNLKSLLDEDYKVSVAISGVQAMTSIGRNIPDLILLDYEMPVMDGKQVLELIRADIKLIHIPVIFMTGVSEREQVSEVVKLKPAGYLLKPPVKETLISEIERALKEVKKLI